MEEVVAKLGIPRDRVFTDHRACLEKARPEIVILCPAASRHGEWVSKVAPSGAHIMVEKPFAGSLAEADRMVRAMPRSSRLMINWPLQWSASHRKAHHLVAEGLIGEVLNVWHFGGNRGPLWHGADKDEKTAEDVARDKPKSWLYSRPTAAAPFSITSGTEPALGTWYQGGRRPLDVTAVVDQPPGLEVDEHSIVVARYPHGL